ncbi:sperm-associated antigen 8 [Genypterus blacodes]|uniref:sperm-associated antigen 8 n=1 Tax=Genypterus blacodes TaxID=154954 RepID=UPI003F7752FB
MSAEGTRAHDAARGDEAEEEEESSAQKHRYGRRDLLSADLDSGMESVTTHRAAFSAPKGAGVRQRGRRAELLQTHLARLIRQQEQARSEAPPPLTDFCSTTQRDFSVQGFVPVTPQVTQVHDYTSDPAVTFWSENYRQIQGVSATQTPNTPFRKSTAFSKPIGERLDDPELRHHNGDI